MATRKDARQVFKRARILAYWSLIGLLVPLAGIILGIISLTTISVMSPANEDERESLVRVRRFAWVGISMSIAMIIIEAVVILLLVSYSPSSSAPKVSHSTSSTVTGTLSLHDSDAFSSLHSGDTCEGSNDGYDDIIQGAQVVASDGSGTVLAVTQLGSGTADGSSNCVFNFTFNNVPYESFYKFEVSHRGELDYSYQQLSDNGFEVDMTLGN